MRASQQKQKVWIDADTGNEVDDPYAIVRLLIEPSVEVIGLSSVHFNNADMLVFEHWNQYPTRGIDTVGISQRLNVELLETLGLMSIPHPLGADRQIGRAWGGTTPRPSPASTELIAAVHRLVPGERLDILAMGALTNIASAIIIDPSILPRIKCYALAAQYDVQTGVWNKNEFNVRGDLNAFDYLLNEPSFDIVHLPTNVTRPFVFELNDVVTAFDDRVPVQKFLKTRWQETDGTSKQRVLWDLALSEAYLLPELTTIQPVHAPPENGGRLLHAYTHIDAPALRADFWKSMGIEKQ